MNKKMRRMIKERRKKFLQPVDETKLSRNKRWRWEREQMRIFVENAKKKWDLKKIHKDSLRNATAVLKSEKVACFYCSRVFPPSDFSDCDLREELEGGPDSRTAWCPHCGIDSIIAESDEYEITDELVEAMGIMAFGESKASRYKSPYPMYIEIE